MMGLERGLLGMKRFSRRFLVLPARWTYNGMYVFNCTMSLGVPLTRQYDRYCWEYFAVLCLMTILLDNVDD